MPPRILRLRVSSLFSLMQLAEGLFTFKWVGDELTAINKAVGGNYITGKLHQEVSPKRRTG